MLRVCAAWRAVVWFPAGTNLADFGPGVALATCVFFYPFCVCTVLQIRHQLFILNFLTLFIVLLHAIYC